MMSGKRTVEAAFKSLPPSLVVIQNGQVIQVDEWCLHNLVPWKIIQIQRMGDNDFCSHVGDPEHGGGSQRGTLDRILEGFHPEVQAQYRELLGLQNADEAQVHALKDFSKHKVVVKEN